MVDAHRKAIFFLGRRRVERRQREQRIRRHVVAHWEPGQQRRHGLRARCALTRTRTDGLTGENSAPRLVTGHGFGEAQAGPLAQSFEAAEEERAIGRDRPAKRTAELVELEILLVAVILAR